MICPNINSPDWKKLVKKHGETKAWQVYIENNYEIPRVEKIRKPFFDMVRGFVIPQGKTLQEINKNPELSSEVIDSLKKLMPNIIINKGGIIKEDGTFVALKPGDKGMHIRNALHSMVAWANDAYLETPPHEYAHEYIEMFSEAPLVKKAIEKYGKEKLVTKIGRYYTEDFTASGFKLFVRRFWNMLRSLFGQPNIKYELYKAFKEGKELSTDVTRGTDTVSYQKIKTPYKRVESTYYEDEDLNAGLTEMYDYVNDSIGAEENLVKDFIINKITEKFGGIIEKINDKDYLLGALAKDISKVKDYYRGAVTHLKEIDRDLNNRYKNVHTFDENTDLKYFTNLLEVGKEKFTDAITLYSLYHLASQQYGSENIVDDFPFRKYFGKDTKKTREYIQKKGIELAEKYIDINKRATWVNEERQNINLLGKEKIPIDNVVALTENEIESASKKRKNFWYKKGIFKNSKAAQSFFGTVTSLLNTYLSNARLQAKFLSGKADSIIQKIFYDEFENARHKRLEIRGRGREQYNQVINNSENLDGSFFKNNNKSIDQISNINIVLDNTNLKLTEAEFTSLYLILRNEKVKNEVVGKGDKKGSGVVFGDIILDRNLHKIKNDYKISQEEYEEIVDKFENNKRLMDNVEKFDKTLKVMFNDLNKAHIAETGVPLDEIPNYFPITYGPKNNSLRTQKRNVDFIGSRYSRKHDNSPVRVTDVYETLNNYIDNVSYYAAYAIPIINAKKVVKRLKRTYEKDKRRDDYKTIKDLIEALEGNITNLEDNSLLFSSTGEKKIQDWVNQKLANISVAVLATNVPVFFKQPISYQAAAEVIDVKFLQKAGWGKGMIAGIPWNSVFSQLKRKKIMANKSIFPLEWRMDMNNPYYKLIKEFSPIIFERIDEGSINKELGEAMMDSRISKDNVKIPWTGFLRKFFGDKTDADYEFSKNAMMAGIKAFDTATVMTLWRAAEYEAMEVLGLKKSNRKEFYEHVSKRTEELINQTQPTFDLNNRAGLSISKHSLARFLTMFGSARSKMGMLLIEGVVDYMNNPNDKEVRNRMFKRTVNITVLSAAALVAVDLIRQFTLGSGFDDPKKDVAPFVAWKMLSTVLGNFYVLGTFSDYAASNLDDQPWRRDIQNPVNALAEDVADVIVHSVKGDFGKAALKAFEATAKSNGAPLYPYIVTKNIVKRIND
jgi:hypothetical protein